MEEEIHGGLHEGEKENNQRRKMSDELKSCRDHWQFLAPHIKERRTSQHLHQAVEIAESLESHLKIAVEALEEVSRNQYISAIVDEVARDALAKIRS